MAETSEKAADNWNVRAADIETCEWTYDDIDDKWDTSCGNAWVMTDGGTPPDNGYNYCPSCGDRIVVKEAEE